MKQTCDFSVLVLILCASLRVVACNQIKINDLKAKNNQVKIVHYALKTADNSIKIKSVGVKNIKIEAFDNWLAKAKVNTQNYNQTGWSIVEFETNADVDDYAQAFSVGYLEGVLTRDLISLHLINTVGDFCEDESETCQKLINFLTDNFKWVSKQIKNNQDDPYWHQVDLVFAQFFGVFNGYYNLTQKLKNKKSNMLENMIFDIKPYLKLLALQLNGDMSELLASITKLSNPFIAGSCSALIKLLPNNNDLYVSHDTWTVYESMLRIIKHYKLNYHLTNEDSNIIPGNEISMSSYPGILSSIDDFNIINTHLVVLETTIGNSNADLWKFVTPSTNLYWVRNLVANRLSNTGSEWAKWFSLYNSGTYNNQWMIVDYKQFTPNENLKDGLLTVLEQIPGQIIWEDKTEVLRNKGYWPSYNLAYYPVIYNISGTYDAFLKYGNFFSYEDSPRASIFRRDQSQVHDISSMIELMRYNNYTKDPLSRCDCNPPFSGENTIAARSDLNPANGKYPFDALGHRDHGATDMKLTNYQMSKSLQFIGISGPTHDNIDIIPFSWSSSDFGNQTAHFGLPETYKFDPIRVQWTL